MTETRPRRVRDLQPGDEVASSDDTRVWTVTEAGGPRRGLWRVTMTSPGREPYSYDYHPDELAPAPYGGTR